VRAGEAGDDRRPPRFPAGAEVELGLRVRMGGDPVTLAIATHVQGRWLPKRRPVEPGRARGDRALDHELVERAQAGDETAFTELAARIGDRMYAAAQHILHDSGRAEDAVQQAMISIWRQLPRLEDPDRFQGWAHRIVIRAAYAEARRRRIWQAKSVKSSAGRTSAPDHASGVADREQLERGFQALGLDHRAVLVLKHYSGLSNAEIAEALDIPEGTVRSRLHHGIRALRAALEADARMPGRDVR
jgi:RNA polymerase sigma-70 factor, ECF subfamily